jgi:Ca-activated chloride channel family protein
MVMAHLRILTVLAAIVGLVLRGPARVDAQSPTFKSGVDLVPLTVTVTDTTGRYVTGLTGTDFTVFEDGVEQPLSFFASDDVPVDLALVLDTSESMLTDLPLVQTAASGLIRQLRASDRGAVVEVKDTAGIPQPFTSDQAQITRAIHGLSPSGSTALYDGLYVVLREFERERRAAFQVRRQVLVLLSDGLDNKSHVTFDEVMDLARRAGVNIYVIALRGEVALMRRVEMDESMLRAEYTMGAVARESGGRTFFPKSARELPAIYTAIAQELASQYELGYVPARPGGDGAFRRVAVRVPPRPNVLARTRSGYYAPRTKAGL